MIHVLAGHAPTRPGHVAWLTGLGACTVGAGAHGRCAIQGPQHALTARFEIDDAWASTEHVHLRASFGGFLLEDAGAKNGVRVAGARVRRHRLRDGDFIEIGRTHLLYREQDVDPTVGAQPGVVEVARFGSVSTLTLRWATELRALTQLAPSDLSILLLGETGVGKDVLAQAIHAASARSGPLVPINCGAIPGPLAEGLLFGHRRGAFSGATGDEVGLLRSARGGTVFLDEIGDLPVATQPVLLRVLQDRAVLALGETRPEVVDMRFVAATNQDLDALVAAGRFRADLLARLAMHRVAIPALRERVEDLGLLIGAILREAGAAETTLSADSCRALLAYAWPGNVRELSAILHRALTLARGAPITCAHLPPQFATPASSPELRNPQPVAVDNLDAADRALYEALRAQLVVHRGNISAVARGMGKDRRQIHRWLRRFGVRPEMFT